MVALLRSKFNRVRNSPSFWALGDRAMMSLGRFITIFAVMRSLHATEFATFVLLVGIIDLLNNLHESLITYPLSVKGARTDDNGLRDLTGSFLTLTGALALPMVLVMLAVSGVLHSMAVAPFVALSMIASQCQETTRRALM